MNRQSIRTDHCEVLSFHREILLPEMRHGTSIVVCVRPGMANYTAEEDAKTVQTYIYR